MPTQIGVGSQGVWSPFWVQNGAAFGAGTNDLAEQANMTYVPNATLAHPYYHATTNPNAHWVKIDMNTAGVTKIGNVGDADFAATAPDATRRWGHVLRFTFRKDGNPTSLARWLNVTGGGAYFEMDTDGTLISHPNVNAGVYRAISAIGNNAPYEIEVWYIPKDASGANLVGRTGFLAVQVVVRIDTNPGGTPALTTLMNVLAEGASAVTASHLIMEVGDSSARGAVNFYYSNIYGPNWEDADAPYGAVRVEEYIPTADYDSGFTLGSFADWDEAGPDDITTRIQQATYAASANELSETVANGAGGTSGITASDAVICASTVTRAVLLASDSKGSSVLFYASIHDGTTLLKKASSPGLTNWAYRTRFWRTDPSAAAWGQAALANIKIGASYDTVVATPSNRSFSACRAYIAWVKDGEEYPAVPAIVRGDPPFPRRPIRNLLVTR